MHNTNRHSPQAQKEKLNSAAMLAYSIFLCLAASLIVSSICGLISIIPSFIFEKLEDDRGVMFLWGSLVGLAIFIALALVIRGFIAHLCDEDDEAG